MCTALEKLLLIKILFFRWHRISPEGYRQVFTKIDEHHLCQLNNVMLNNLSGLDLVRRSRSHVKGHRRGGVCVLRMLLVCNFIVKAIIMNFMEDWEMGIIYVPTELHKSINNEDLLSDKNHRKHTHTHTHTHTNTYTRTQSKREIETDTLSI